MIFGGMIGALISGKVADIFGRRTVSLFSFTKFIELLLVKKSLNLNQLLKFLIWFIIHTDNVAFGFIFYHGLVFNNLWQGTENVFYLIYTGKLLFSSLSVCVCARAPFPSSLYFFQSGHVTVLSKYDYLVQLTSLCLLKESLVA